jgi:hypothetical protein
MRQGLRCASRVCGPSLSGGGTNPSQFIRLRCDTDIKQPFNCQHVVYKTLVKIVVPAFATFVLLFLLNIHVKSMPYREKRGVSSGAPVSHNKIKYLQCHRLPTMVFTSR